MKRRLGWVVALAVGMGLCTAAGAGVVADGELKLSLTGGDEAGSLDAVCR